MNNTFYKVKLYSFINVVSFPNHANWLKSNLYVNFEAVGSGFHSFSPATCK